jgi:hypothetical protein
LAHGALDAAIPEGRFRRPALQIRRLRHCSGRLGFAPQFNAAHLIGTAVGAYNHHELVVRFRREQ